jgi:hypothetical protein
MTNDSRCATCGKATSTFTCRGCAKGFCMSHANEHRQELVKQVEEYIIPLHDQLRQNFGKQTKKTLDHHPLMKQIDDWERDSIDKIHQVAGDAREQLLNLIDKHTGKLKEALKRLTQELKKARDDDHFLETDLKEWMKKLEDLKKESITPNTINVQYGNTVPPFILKILINETANISDECFEQLLGKVILSDNGRVATHYQTNRYASVRGRREYSSGEHRFRLVIETLSARKWVFFGVLSKNASAPSVSQPSKTSYGFSGSNQVWCDGANMTGLNNYKSDFETNDTIELLINCDQRTIRLTNERTLSSHVLDVNITKCSFPWKLSVAFYYSSGDRIRLLS